MKLFLLFIFVLIASCEIDRSPVVNGTKSKGNMPFEAKNVDEYKIRLLRTIDTTVTPKVTFNSSEDTLSLCFNYKQQGDDLPDGDLPHNILHEKTFPNLDDIWDSNNEAKLKFWVILEPGLWQATVAASNRSGSDTSSRYDFFVEDPEGLKLCILGIFK